MNHNDHEGATLPNRPTAHPNDLHPQQFNTLDFSV